MLAEFVKDSVSPGASGFGDLFWVYDFYLDPKVCRIIAFLAVFRGLGLLFYILFVFGQGSAQGGGLGVWFAGRASTDHASCLPSLVSKMLKLWKTLNPKLSTPNPKPLNPKP